MQKTPFISQAKTVLMGLQNNKLKKLERLATTIGGKIKNGNLKKIPVFTETDWLDVILPLYRQFRRAAKGRDQSILPLH